MTLHTKTQPPGLTYPWEHAPEPGAVTEIASGVLWARLPLPMKLDHVNVYILDDATHWTLIDTGLDWAKGRAAWGALLAGPLAGKPVGRVILTHHHPDHIGLAGWFAAQGAEIWATRIAWLFGRMLTLDHHDRPTPQHIEFRRRAGMPEDLLAAYAREKPFNFSTCVAPIPLGFRAIDEGEEIAMAGRRWTVRFGHGHAPAHATFWSGDGLVLAGDQVIPGISSNISVYPTEAEAFRAATAGRRGHDGSGTGLARIRRGAVVRLDPLSRPARPVRSAEGLSARSAGTQQQARRASASPGDIHRPRRDPRLPDPPRPLHPRGL